MPPFTPLRDRDAWSTIRGYVYQVDLTIQRWLDLAPHQILELERGEDIDIVSRALTADLEERDRLLEQVKHRDSSITLRTPEAVAAIACFIEHRQTNLTADLIFQFTTNTKVGREQPSPLPERMPAIEAWEHLRQGTFQEGIRDAVLAGISQILRNAKKPDDLQKDTWQRFCNFIQTATDEKLLELIHKFQWRTKAPDARSLSSTLQRELLDRRHATTSLQAQEQYQRLFWYVFNRLCKRGRKQLTLEELHDQLTLPTLSSSDRETFKILRNWLQEIDVRVTNLEQEQQQTSQVVADLRAEVQQLARSQGIDQAVSYVISTLILNVPPLVERSSLRVETIESLAQVLTNHTWIAIYGSLGSGKTQLAVLVVEYLISQGLCAYCSWLRLRDLTIEQACLRLDQAVETLVGTPFQGNLNKWYSQLCDNLDSTAILVLDDLPRLERADELEGRLIQLARVCHNEGVRLLSTSPHQLPQNLRAVLGSQIIHSIQTPLFTNHEASEIFQAYHAPNSFLNPDRVAYLNELARQHPSLLAAIAEYLHRQNWQFTPQTFDALLRGEYTSDVNEETLDRLLTAIQDDRSQELLYRLNLIMGYFSIEDMQALAAVDPTVERPRQRLNGLLGVWIQRDVSNRLMVSPLVKALGSDDLSVAVRRRCHLTIGERIVQQSGFNQYKAFNAICHFHLAEAFNKAGALLLLALDGLEDSETQIDDGGLLALWSEQPLPEQMDLGIRLSIRGLQISARNKYQRDNNYLISDLDRLLEQATAQEAGMIVALVARLISKFPDQVGFVRINRYFLVALRFLSDARLPDSSELSLPETVTFESLIWAIARAVGNAADLRDWMHTIEQLTSKQRERAFSTKATEAGCLMVSEQLWLREAEKPEIEQDWQAVLVAIRALVDCASNLKLELLWACAVSCEMIVLAEYSNDLNQAIEVAKSAIARASNNPRIQFLLKEGLGRELGYASRNDEAINWLTQALEQPTESYPVLRMSALLRCSRFIATQEPYLSLQYAQQAVNLVQSSEQIPEIELVIALGELAIARWLINDVSAAFEAWSQAGERLLKCRTDKDYWKGLFVLYAHVTGYFTALATTGNPPPNMESGEPYTAPFRGIFLTRNIARSTYYNPSRDCVLLTQLAQFAEAVSNDERAFAWALKGIDMARDAQQFLPITSLSRNIIPQLVLESRYSETLDLAVEVGTLLVAFSKLEQSGRNMLELGIDAQMILSSRESELWRQAESCALIIGVLPIIFRLADLAIHQPELARNQAMDIAEMCQEIVVMSGTQTLWATVADIFEQIHLQQSTCAALINQYQTLSSPDRILPIIGLVAATLQQNIPLNDVLRVHFSILERLQSLTKPKSTVYRCIILPYLFNYWRRSVEQVMFRFEDAQMTAQLLYAARELPADQQAQAILITVASGLGIQVQPNI